MCFAIAIDGDFVWNAEDHKEQNSSFWCSVLQGLLQIVLFGHIGSLYHVFRVARPAMYSLKRLPACLSLSALERVASHEVWRDNPTESDEFNGQARAARC
jgi:hypothetical protein